MQRAMADKKEENSDHDAGANLRPRGTQALGHAPHEKNGACKEMPEARRVERRNAFHRIANRQIRGSPDKVNGEKAKDNRNAVAPIESRRRDHRQSFFDSEGNLISAHLSTHFMRR